VRMKIWMAVCLSVGWVCIAGAVEPKPITVAAGQEFEITLESPSGNDHQWLLSRPLDESRLKQSERRFKRGVGGRSGSEVLRYKALAEGKTQIHLQYAALWDKSQAPSRNTNFVVVISKSVNTAAK
jgi:predicted secreted protein